MKGVFITGTDTNVGKTVASAALMHRYRATRSMCYWKPIQTGIEQDDDTETVRRLGGCMEQEVCTKGLRLPTPVSPHLAARRAGVTIDLEKLALLRPKDDTAWIVEGAGGLLVPINESATIAAWIALLGLPVVVAARSGLGTINHTLLTLEALRRRSLRVAGAIMVGEPNADNREAIEKFGDVQVVAEMPPLDPLNSATLAAWTAAHMDPAGVLLEYLR